MKIKLFFYLFKIENMCKMTIKKEVKDETGFPFQKNESLSDVFILEDNKIPF